MAKVSISDDSEKVVLDVAETVFSSKGFKRGTVRDIALASGLSIGAVASLGPKEQLLVRVMERKIESVQSEVHDISKHKGAVEQIEEVLERFFDLFAEEWVLAREYAAILASGRYDSQVFPAMAENLMDDFARIISGRDARERAKAIYIAYLGSLFLWSASGQDQKEACFSNLRRTVRFLLT